MSDKIGYAAGFLCIVSEYRQDKPEIQRCYYPIGPVNRADWEDLLGREVSRYCDTYVIPGLSGLSFRLVDGGATKPVLVETIPIPCPKVRRGIETRYTWGNGWEKYSQAKGWISAYGGSK